MANASIEHIPVITDDDLTRLSSVDLEGETSAFVVCTSGSTGKFKVIEHAHMGMMHFVRAHTGGFIYITSDKILQLASCHWVIHLFEIINALTIGATLVLIRQDGQLDISYLSRTMANREVSSLIITPVTMRLLTEFAMINNQNAACYRCARVIGIGGKVFGKGL